MRARLLQGEEPRVALARPEQPQRHPEERHRLAAEFEDLAEAPIQELDGRVGAIAAHHDRRLGQVLDLCREPMTLLGVTLGLFGPREGYTRLLALEEAGAHVEYLFQRGELGIANLDEVSQQANPVIRYETRRGAAV